MYTFRPRIAIPLILALNLFSSLSLVLGQYPKPSFATTNVTTIRSPVDRDIVIHFKSPPVGTCTTVFQAQKQYTGYVVLPPRKLAPIQQNYYVNTFFWFIEARTNASNAPLTIFINGGPGSSSMVGLFQEAGPCEVVEIARGKLGTQAREWGWDRSSNVLFIDQPNQVGFSFDKLTNGSLDLIDSTVNFAPSSAAGQPEHTYLDGTFSSNNANASANTTEIAAHSMWHMLQGFLAAFPQYNPAVTMNNTQSGPVGINLFTESYGGKYGPLFAAHFESQNALRRSGKLPKNKTLEIRLASLGIIQGCVDDAVQGRFYPIFANNNTYGIKALSLADQQNAASSYLSANGCQQQIQSCRTAVTSMDPGNEGDVDRVNQVCKSAQDSCSRTVIGPYLTSGRSLYDITQIMPSPFPPSTYLEYLNTAELQSAIGVAVNYTESNSAIGNAFLQTGDYERGDQIHQLGYLLSLGVRVALIYGDRDYVCNWLGGEAISFAIAAQSPAYSRFYSAGYAPIVVNSTYVGGVVRQFGNLSFSRIYDAGHLVPAYQPETAFTVFSRVILGTDLSFGQPVDLGTYQTNGTGNATYTSKAPESAKPTCWIRNINNTCTDEQKNKIFKGEGEVVNGILYDNPSDWHTPASSISVEAGYPGTAPPAMTATSLVSSSPGDMATSSKDIPTGVYVATATPSTSQRGSSCKSIAFDFSLLLLSCSMIMMVTYAL
ncbi:MAG: hypothetical protein L6R40_005144 [Gallowayella cf. fulva]|nr:MAG: hypothetical protein L6R40_005144 [Xanthomendoza cf. fulva]